MGVPDNIELVSVLPADCLALFETRGFKREYSLMALSCTSEEASQFNAALHSRPFGARKAHHVWLHSLVEGKSLECFLRISSMGSRKEVRFPVCQATYDGLHFILWQFALDPELVPEMPSSVQNASASG